MRTPDEQRKYERERRKAWRDKNPEHARAYAKWTYDSRGHLRKAREQKPIAADKPDFLECRKCKETKPFDEKHFNIALQNLFKLTYHCRACMLKRHSINQSKRKYKLTTDEVLRLRTFTVCCICEEKPEGRLVIDHCHETGVVRGMLCKFCNMALGLLRDEPKRMRAAAAYVEAFK